jgi:hypothetical protein
MAEGKPTVKQVHKAEIAYKFYINEGWTPEQASGIVGSLITESGNFNEDVISGKKLGDGGKAFGIAQWHPNRQAKAKELYGDNWKDFNNQLRFVQWELNNTENKAGRALKSSKGVWQAGTVFANQYERPALRFSADDVRQTNVTDTYRKYGKTKLTEEDRKMFEDSETSYKNSVQPYMNPTQQPTSNFINFQTPQISGNFADVPDVYREPEKETEQKPSSESLQKLKENAFLEEYQQAQEQQYAEQQQEESQPNPMMTTDVYGMAENVEKMVVGQQGGQKIIEDNSGYWNPKNQGRVVKIDGGDITMKGVNEILIGVSDKGERQIMYPNQNYQFKDAKYVTEYPTITDRERAFLNKIKNK